MRPISRFLLALPVMVLPVLVLAVLVLAGGAKAEPGIETYEATYLASCKVDLARSDCHCRMAAIEEALSHRLFAQLVARYGGDIREVLPDEAIAAQVAQRCGAAGKVHGEVTRAAAN